MKHLFHKVLSHPALLEQPPVLVDIGASGEIHSRWKQIAPYSTCIAFDADTRDFSVSEKSHSGYKKLYLINRIVAAEPSESLDFYLTRSPHCSSSLHPDNHALRSWAFAPLFDVKEKVTLQTITLSQALHDCGIAYIDWYKTDSQGTDLKIFDSLAKDIIHKIMIAEFEPGILDGYMEEDKLHELMAYMDEEPFWVHDMFIKGSQRIGKDDLDSLNRIQKRFPHSFIRTSPGWCEISYINAFEADLQLREHLLGWVFSALKKEHGFALGLANRGYELFGDPLFVEMATDSRREIQKGYFSLSRYLVLRSIKRLWSPHSE